MAVEFQPPPTYADPVVIDDNSKRSQFNPIWLKWFLDLAQYVTQTGNQSTGTGPLVRQNSPTVLDQTVDWINFETAVSPAVVPKAGRVWYQDGVLNVGFPGDVQAVQVGQQGLVYGKASSAVSRVDLQLVARTGVDAAAGVVEFAPAGAGIVDSSLFCGVAFQDIGAGALGRVLQSGIVTGINTTGAVYGETWADGDVLYYNQTSGGLTNIPPQSPDLKTKVGTVIDATASGSFFVALGFSAKWGDIESDVQFGAGTLLDDQIAVYDATLEYWKNKDLEVGAAGTLQITSSAGALTFETVGASGTFVTADIPPQTVTVVDGVITSIV